MWRRVLLCALLAGAVRAAIVYPAEEDCAAARSVLLQRGVAESALSSSGGSSEVCESGSCCSRHWELGIRDLVHRDFRSRLVDNTDQVKSLLHRQATAVQDAILRLIHGANHSTIDSYSHETDEGGTQTSDDVARRALPTLFSQFQRYFQSELTDPQLEAAVTEFFDQLFVTTYARGAPLNATFERCLRQQRLQMQPFQNVPFRMKEKLLRTFGLAKFYLQSLYGGLEVLNTTTQLECSDSCQQALTRLSYCPLCRGVRPAAAPPCNEFCFNVMRGCMAPLSTLSESWQAYVEVLRRLAASLQAGNSVETYLLKLYVNISEAMSLVFAYREQLEEQVRQLCGSSPPSPARRRRRTVEMPYRSSGDLGGALPPLPRRLHLVDFEQEGELLNKLLHTFKSDVEQHRYLFQDMPEQACNDMVADTDAAHCWNGSQLGEYNKPVAGLGLDSQEFNPEVRVPQIPDPALRERADLLDQIHQGSNDKLASVPPSDDFLYEDAGSGSGGHMFYDDEDDYFFSTYEDEHAGSGSGDWAYPTYDDEYPDEDVTLPPAGRDGDESDLSIGDPELDPPGVDVDPVPSTVRPDAESRPAGPTKPAAGAALPAAAGLWTLVAAALLAGRL